MANKTFIIAEAGVNHNGSLGAARKMVYAAAKSGADGIKFQTFIAGAIATKSAPQAEYQKRAAKGFRSQFQMLKKLELNKGAFIKLQAHCKKMRIEFMSSAFDIESLNFLSRLGLRTLKIPSGEIDNVPYLRKAGALKRKILLSTGMSDLDEVREAIKILVSCGTRKDDITIMQCTTAYPAPFENANLNAMLTMKKVLGVNVGYSDHTPGTEMAIAAVALGATVIEKHFTLDKNMRGPDHRASLEPREFNEMVSAVRNVEKGLGDGIKRPLAAELKNRDIVRKSIVAARHIGKGEEFFEANITTKRPAYGMSPIKWDSVIGRRAKRTYKKDEFIIL
ncbi:MAG: N-acetylneuraminate synthase [Candidatus Omnitrophica bacterium]|nr:N-acetylneuraminate synthase [Candidatus Omnitrophota bacterium]